MAKHAGENVFLANVVTDPSVPEHVQALVVFSLVLVAEVGPGKEQSVQAHVEKQPGLLLGVTEGVNLPRYTWVRATAKSVLQKLHPKAHVVNDGAVVGSGLVIHAPA